MGNACGIPGVKKLATIRGRRHQEIHNGKCHKKTPIKPNAANNSGQNFKQQHNEKRLQDTKPCNCSKKVENIPNIVKDVKTNVKNREQKSEKNIEKRKLLNKNSDNEKPISKRHPKEKNIEPISSFNRPIHNRKIKDKKFRNRILAVKETSSSDFSLNFSCSSSRTHIRRDNPQAKEKGSKRTSEWQEEENRLQKEYQLAEEKIRNSLRDEQRAKAEAQTWRAKLEKLTYQHRDRLFKQAQTLRSRLRNAEELLTFHEARAKRLQNKNEKMRDLISDVKKEAQTLQAESEKKRKAAQKNFTEKLSTVEERLVKLQLKVGQTELMKISEQSKRDSPVVDSDSNNFGISLSPFQSVSNCPNTRSSNRGGIMVLKSYSRHCNSSKPDSGTLSSKFLANKVRPSVVYSSRNSYSTNNVTESPCLQQAASPPNGTCCYNSSLKNNSCKGRSNDKSNRSRVIKTSPSRPLIMRYKPIDIVSQPLISEARDQSQNHAVHLNTRLPPTPTKYFPEFKSKEDFFLLSNSEKPLNYWRPCTLPNASYHSSVSHADFCSHCSSVSPFSANSSTEPLLVTCNKLGCTKSADEVHNTYRPCKERGCFLVDHQVVSSAAHKQKECGSGMKQSKIPILQPGSVIEKDVSSRENKTSAVTRRSSNYSSSASSSILMRLFRASRASGESSFISTINSVK